MNRNALTAIRYGAILMAVGIILGAFGAHGLRAHLGAADLDTYQTGVLYHLLHSLAILIIGALLASNPQLMLTWVIRSFLLGILCFSGSIYLLATSDLTGIPTKILGPITPLGGIFFLVGWIMLAWKCRGANKKEHG